MKISHSKRSFGNSSQPNQEKNLFLSSILKKSFENNTET